MFPPSRKQRGQGGEPAVEKTPILDFVIAVQWLRPGSHILTWYDQAVLPAPSAATIRSSAFVNDQVGLVVSLGILASFLPHPVSTLHFLASVGNVDLIGPDSAFGQNGYAVGQHFSESPSNKK